jgi:aminopeptidase N
MLERDLGAAVFRAGIQKYLKRHRFANADAGDLWRALGEASGRAVGEMMAEWVLRPGYPLVNVRAEAGSKTLVFSQRRFTYQSDGPPSAVWKIPIAFRVRLPDAVKSMRVLLSSHEARVELPAPAEWVVVNENAYGFYRTLYTQELLSKLAPRLFEILSPLERLALVSDIWAAVLASATPVSDYLDLTARFGEETDRNVWSAIIESFAYLGRVVFEQDRPALAALLRDRLGPAAARLGWSPAVGENQTQQELRADLLRALGTHGDDPTILASARQLHRGSGQEPSAVHPSLAAAVLAILAHEATESDWVEFVERAEKSKTAQEARRYIFALSYLREPVLIQRTLQMVIDGRVRSQDSPSLVRNLLMSAPARELAWRFVKDNWNELFHKFTQNSLARMCEGVAGLVTQDLEADVRDFFSYRSTALGGKTLQQYLEKLGVGVAFRQREAAALSIYLSRIHSSR